MQHSEFLLYLFIILAQTGVSEPASVSQAQNQTQAQTPASFNSTYIAPALQQRPDQVSSPNVSAPITNPMDTVPVGGGFGANSSNLLSSLPAMLLPPSSAPPLSNPSGLPPVLLQSAVLHALRLIRDLLERDPLTQMKLVEHPKLLLSMRLLWNKALMRRDLSQRTEEEYEPQAGSAPFPLQGEDTLRALYEQDEEARLLCHCLLWHCKQHPDAAEVLMELLPVLQFSNTVDFSFLAEFCQSELPRLYTVSQKRNILRMFFNSFFSMNLQDESRAAQTATEMKVKVLGVRKMALKYLLYLIALCPI